VCGKDEVVQLKTLLSLLAIKESIHKTTKSVKGKPQREYYNYVLQTDKITKLCCDTKTIINTHIQLMKARKARLGFDH